ncbi:MAG: toll/interleukin-1 receptor domain-containing protein [Candidatus Acidiferrales bacterium]
MAHDVFISYSSKDKPTADAVCATLELNGVRCWIAPRDVTAGMEWGECIIDAIEECRIMVLVFTADADASPQIRREVERAVNHSVAILPFRIEDVMPGKALEYFIGNVHWLDALTTPMEKHLQDLAGTAKLLLGRMEAGDAASPVTPAPRTTLVPSESDMPETVQPIRQRTAPAGEPAFAPGPPAPGSQRAGPSAVVAVGAEKPLARRLWFRAVLGGAGLLIVVLSVVLYFSRKSAMPQQNRMDWSNQDLASVQSAARNGNAGAESEIGYRYYFGQGGVGQDYSQALTWFRKSAEQGNAAGENGLGVIYLNGAGVPKDYAQALVWYRKAADQGYDSAENDLGYMYEFGRGVQQDDVLALIWFHKAADQNNGMALENLGYAYLNGRGVPRDPAQARIWFRKAADQGNEDAAKQLAALDGQH